MPETTTLIQKLYKAGSHFGFSKSRRHPSVKPYIFGTKDGVDMFDLAEAERLAKEAADIMRAWGEAGKVVLFVSTKEEVSDIVRAAAARAGMPFVTNRWIGGTLTNFSEVKKRLARLAMLKEQQASGELERKYTKKERVMLGREAAKLEYNFGGIAALDRAPDAMFVVDPRHDVVAVTEALVAGIPVVAVANSDCDLSSITYPVVGNDAHRESVMTLTSGLVDAFIDGRSRYVPKAPAPRTPRGARTETASTRR